ncbi:MAG: flagellar hook-associated protein FlgL [Firmicutes bacterium]|nr:flagellar hook-associated protein FlgL [Bacillota bacterium]
MRVTNSIIASNTINGIQNNLERLARSQEQISANSRILRPSDNPNVLGQLFGVRNTLSYNEQYNQNIQDGLSFLDLADTSMASVKKILDDAYEHAIDANNADCAPEDRAAIAEQIDKLIDTVVDMANSTVGGRYIYAGTKNSRPPFSRNGDIIEYRGDLGEVTREVASATHHRVDVPGIGTDPANPGVFGVSTAGPDPNGVYTVDEGIFKTLIDFKDSLLTDPFPGADSSITAIQNETDNVLKHSVTAGARYQHFEYLQKNLLNQEVNLTDTINDIEGANIPKLSIELGQHQLSYNSSLAVGSMIMQTSLLDFLR